MRFYNQDCIHDLFKHEPSAEKRHREILNNWQAVMLAERSPVTASNTYAPSLVTQFLIDGLTTKLQNRLCSLSAFSKEFKPDPLKPIAVVNLKLATGTDGNVQQNPTNWEAGDSTIADVQAGPVHYSRSWHVTQAELDSGLQMENLLEVNTASFADAIMQAACAPMTSANFQSPALIRPPDNFGWSDMQTLWGQLKKSAVKNAVLDGEYLSQIINAPSQFQESSAEPGAGWKKFGWNELLLNTNWAGADANTRGFACNPQAIMAVAGLPLAPFGAAGNIEMLTVKIAGPDIYVQFSRWFALSSRTLWYSFDLVFGASALDTSAGILIKSS